MDAPDSAAGVDLPMIPRLAARIEHGVDLRRASRAGRGKDRRRPVANVRPANRLDGRNVSVHHVRAAAAMHVNVDEAGADVSAFGIDQRRSGRNLAGGPADVSDLVATANHDGILDHGDRAKRRSRRRRKSWSSNHSGCAGAVRLTGSGRIRLPIRRAYESLAISRKHNRPVPHKVFHGAVPTSGVKKQSPEKPATVGKTDVVVGRDH